MGAGGRGGPCSQILDVFVPGKLTRSVNDLDVDVSKTQVWRMIPKDVKLVSGKSQSLLSNPMDCSLPGSSVHGIFQARVLEWGAIVFSDE